MAEKTDEQIAKDNSTTIDALSVYLDDVAPAEQFGSNPLHRIGNIQPIQTQEDLFERGLIGEDGLLTPKGDLYKTLSDNGLINPDGTLPEKSAAFMMDEDDALKPENLNAYVIRRENKIGEKPMSWGDTFGGLGELLWDAGAGLGTMVKLGIQNIGVRDVAYTDPLGISSIPTSEEKLQEIQKRKDQLLNRSSIAATSFVENSIKAFSETGAIVNLAGAAVSSIPARIMGDEKIASDQVNAARQAQDRLIKSNQDAAIGSTLDAVFQTATYVPEMARVKSEMPKAEFDKIIKQTGAAGQIFADPVELAKIGTVMKLATQPIVSRLTLNAERVIGKASDRAARLAEINVEIADVERAKGMTQNAAELARKTADAARERFDLNGDQLLLQRANAAEEIFNRSTAKVGQFTDDGVRLANEAAELTAETQKLASRIPVAAAQAFEATAKAGRELKAVPFKAFAATIEPVSRGLIALDDGLDAVSKKLGIGAAYDIMTSKVGQAVGYGAAIGLGPAPALIGAAGSVLKSGPFLQRLADTSRILGTEMAKAQSQVPFFQRVANNPMISPAHRSLAHLSDLATLGGFLPDITRRAAKGAAVSFPLDFAAQYMSDGGEINQNTFKQAFAESLLIGGSSAALGGMFAGTKQRHRDLAVNDEINFRNEITAPDQKQLFTSAPSGIRRAVGTFAAVFPSVNIQFTQEGGGFHDDNTIGIDLNSSNPLKYLLAHEVKHLLVHRNQMHTPIVAMMLGDGEAGGIMRAPDGTLNPEFEAFAREYNNRQVSAGRAPVSLGKIAEEFFVEAGVEDMARMSESGELGAIASRTEARRMIGRLFNSVFDKSTVLKDFHLRIGGLMDQGGKLVQGNGLLNPGITQTQEMRNMTRNMLKRAAGRSVGQFEPLGAAEAGNKGEGPGINLPINPDDKAMIEKIGPVMFEMETVNGRRQVVRDSDGNPVPVDFNTQLMRSRTGALIQEAIGNRPSTYQSSPNEMRLNDEGIWEGYLPPDIIEFIKKKGSLNQEQIRMIEHVNSMIKNFKGDVALVINHPATSRNKKGKLNYKTLKATLRQVVPISWNLTKDGNLTLGLMSVTQLKSNIDARISSRLGQQLYQGNRAKLMVDIGKVMELHQQGKRTDEYFDTEYGAAKSQQFKNFVNSVFGLMTKKQGEANPIFSEENLRGNGVYKTYRADRISQATKMTGDKYPFQYDFVVQNMMPNGLPTLDEQGRPVVMNRLPEPTIQTTEDDIPIAKTTTEVSEEIDSKELKSTGVEVPESVDAQSVISNAIQVANSQPWKKGRDFKLDLQRRVLDAAKQAGVVISERTLESIEYLARVGMKDALIALAQNPNAIGWYDEKTKQALGVMSLLFPEIEKNENARFAFTWALAVTSNGLKVDKNFELAERVYRQYRKTGKMPTDIKAGQAQEAINEGLGLFNKLTNEWGIDNTRRFMQTDFTVGEISRLSKDLSPGGEFSDTRVRGSAILGPKIGNGFFSNLYGLFDALTMDRWLVRTWGRWTGTLVELNPELTKQATERLKDAVRNLTPEDKQRMNGMIKDDVSKMNIDDLSIAIQKASMKPALRDLMNTTLTGEEFRKSGNGLAKYLDGQKEAPANPAERNFIREIFGLMLDDLRSDPKYKDLTMADLQAVLWYAEKRLYETAKVNTDQKNLDDSDADGYEDDEAPDYANAAIGVARKQGVSEKRINQILEKVKNERATTAQSEVEGRGQDQPEQQKVAGGFVGREKQKFQQYIAVTTTRRNRTGNEKALWSYQTKGGIDSRNAGILKPRVKKNLGIKYVSELNPGRKLSTIFRGNNLPVVKFLEIDSSDSASAIKFAETIQKSKDASPHGAAVYVYPPEEYQGMKLFLSDSGKSGFAVKPDGDIVSVFSMEKGSGRSIMEAAIAAGGKKLDAFDTVLPEFYGTHGFVEASRMRWDDEFAPPGWDKEAFKEFNNGEPDVVMMVLDLKSQKEYTPKNDIYAEDYDKALQMQNDLLGQVERKSAPQKKAIKRSKASGNASSIDRASKLK